MKLEVVAFNVSDPDRAKAFYENLGWRLDIDVVEGDFRGVHLTPPNSDARSCSARESLQIILARRTA
jgi:catechol 2,3-dioxygenase-like lactoylglutathione lyase family enzyme